MCRLEVVALSALTLLHWELGILALDPSFEVRWRHDLEWNHRLIHLGDEEIWFDLMYESEDVPLRIGDQPWGYSTLTGQELLDRNPPAAADLSPGEGEGLAD